MQIKTVPLGHGWSWIAQGFRLFADNFLMWGAVFLALVVSAVLVNLIPLGNFVFSVLVPVVMGGIMMGAASQERNGPNGFQFEHMWAGFNHPDSTQLLLVGVFVALLQLVLFVVAIGLLIVFGGTAIFGAILTAGDWEASNGGGEAIAALFGGGILLLLGGMFLLFFLANFLITMTAVFAPALVVFQRMSAMDAMRTSFMACLRNIPAIIVNVVLVFLLGIVALIPFGLGYLILGPVLLATIYAAYRDVFGDSGLPDDLDGVMGVVLSKS